jgi:glycosyltransferase involved in cell wall biosynthesis
MGAVPGCASRLPWLSIVMPLHCGEGWIDATLRSVVAEADDGIEIIAVDSSPNGTTLDIARCYSNRLHLLLHERPDLSSWQAKTNLAVTLATSEHICWLHQDDLWLPGRAKAVRHWINEAPNAALHLAPTEIVDANGDLLGKWRCPLPTGGPVPTDILVARLLVQNFISAPAPVFRKSAWIAAGGLDETLWYTADWDIWLKLAAEGTLFYHQETTTGFRIHGDSLTVTGSRDLDGFTAQMETVLSRHLPMLGLQGNVVERTGRASISINAALAAASEGNLCRLPSAIAGLLRLGPSGIIRYIRNSRITERITPRVRAKLRGAF